MPLKKKHTSAISTKPALFPVIGLVSGLLVWIGDAVVDVFILNDEQSLLVNIFIPDEPKELWMRLLVLLVFLLMGFYARKTLIKHIELDKSLLDYQNTLEQIVADRTRVLVDKSAELKKKPRVAEHHEGLTGNAKLACA